MEEEKKKIQPIKCFTDIVAFPPNKMNQTRFAFSIIAHSQLGLLDAQLSLIARPYNSICIHVDAKAEESFKEGVEDLIQCYRKRIPQVEIVQ